MTQVPANLLIVAQSGRLMYEAVIFMASLKANSPQFQGRIFIAEPQPSPAWSRDPRISAQCRALLEDLGAEICPFVSEHFGETYPYGNKIEALSVLPADEPFVFFDTDTLITGELAEVPFDFKKPSASLRVKGTWPKEDLYWPGYDATWRALYDRFELDFESSLDLRQPSEYWRRYLYFNAGFFYYSCPQKFQELFLRYALSIRDAPPEELRLQELDPWLDQIALPLVIHALGGGRSALPEGFLDGKTTCHYRALPLLYARESDAVVDAIEAVTAPNKIKKVLKSYEPILRFIYQKRGQKARALFDQANLPRREQAIRNRLKREGFWMR
ncbi:MAG: hypothetical protein AAGD04_08985 [Pseudomonadota bacterium]